MAGDVDQSPAQRLVLLGQRLRGEQGERRIDGVGTEDGEHHGREAVREVAVRGRDGDGEEETGNADAKGAEDQDVVASHAAEQVSHDEGDEDARGAGGDEADCGLNHAVALVLLEAVVI